MSSTRFLITAALPYSNGGLHVGHIAGAYLPADIYVRYLRARGHDVTFVCGSDDHGVGTLIAARKEGLPPQDIAQRYNRRQAADFAGLGIEFDLYGGTHQPGFADLHARLSQDFFRAIHARGYLKKKASKQLYDLNACQFLPDRYVKGTCYHRRPDGTTCGYPEAYGDQCEVCGNLVEPSLLINPVSVLTGTTPEERETVHWYLRLDQFEEPLRAWLEGKREWQHNLPPWRETTLNFALSQIAQGLPERAMTRDLDWGIPVPLDDHDAASKVLYVWFDAPIGYVSLTANLCQLRGGRWQDYVEWWKNPKCRIVNFIGEDNIIFHAITWPAMLLAEQSLQLPAQVVANQFLNIKLADAEAEKISKSRGTAIWIEDYLRDFDPDPLRYYLTAIAPEGQSTTFSFPDLISRNNNELSNVLGNFIHRTLAFAARYCEERVPDPGVRNEEDLQQLAAIARCRDQVAERIEQFQFKAALVEVMALARCSNRYFDSQAPWRRTKSPSACAATINVCLQTVKALAAIAAPFLPFAADKCLSMLSLNSTALAWDQIAQELPAGHVLGKPEVLFPKMEKR